VWISAIGVVFREADVYVAQCIEYDIATQAKDLDTLLERLDLTLDAECAMSVEREGKPFGNIPPAPNYFHDLWEKRSISIARLHVPVGTHLNLDIGLAKAA
jgi:hypothetical protein